MHRPRDLRDSLKIAKHVLVAVDMSLEDFPIIDSRLSRSSRIRQHKTRLDFFRCDRHGFAVNSISVKMNCAHPAIERWIVILAPSRNRDDLRFDILSNDAHLLQGEVAIGETPKCCRGGNHERRGTGNARASRRFGVCLDEQAFFRRKELKQPRTQGQSKSSRSPKLLKAGEVLLAPGIKG